MATNVSFASPLADASYPVHRAAASGIIGRVADSLNGWTLLLTMFLGLVIYDQCAISQHGCPHVQDADPPTGSYIVQKGTIAGPGWKMPFIGPFLQSMDPKFEEYYAKWLSGPLSCVSVFHKYENQWLFLGEC